MLTAYRFDGAIWCATGCYAGKIDDFAEACRKTHGDSDHGRAYANAVAFFRAQFGAPANPAKKRARKAAK